MNVANAARAVAAAAGEDDRDRLLAGVLRERAEEDVDRERELLLPIPLAQEEATAGDDHLLLGRDQVDVVGLDEHPVLDEVNRQIGVASEELVHEALEVRRQVLDDHERHAARARNVVEERLERLETTGRRADADDVRRHTLDSRVPRHVFLFHWRNSGFAVSARMPYRCAGARDRYAQWSAPLKQATCR